MEFLSLKGDCIGSSEHILVKMQHCWKSHAMAQLLHAQAVYPKVNREEKSVHRALTMVKYHFSILGKRKVREDFAFIGLSKVIKAVRSKTLNLFC